MGHIYMTMNEEKQDIKSKIKYIAGHYGYDAQSRQCMEEAAELIRAVNKHWRAIKYGSIRYMASTKIDMLGEMADVEIMLDQMKYLMGESEVIDKLNIQKLDRQIKRIEEEHNA